MTSITFRDSSLLFDVLQQEMSANRPAIISIDGWAGSGKSQLGRAMALHCVLHAYMSTIIWSQIKESISTP